MSYPNALEENSGNSPLYSNLQRVCIRTSNSEERNKDLRVLVDFSSGINKVSQQTLRISVTDEDDPFFLYSLILTDGDYQQLKASQGLLVDFYNFPAELIRLLTECSNNNGSSVRFLLLLEEEKKEGAAILQTSKTFLKVIEANNFKHLCHIQLQLIPGDDNEIKKLMLSKIRGLKEVICKNDKQIVHLSSQISNLDDQLTLKSKELSVLQQKWHEDKLAFKVESTKEINEETEKLRRAQTEWQLKMQKERNEIEERFLSTIKEKECELSKLRMDNQILLEKKSKFESNLKEQAVKIETLEKELAHAKWDLSSMKKQSTKLDSDYHEKEKAVHSLRTKLAVAEQELKDKALMLSKAQEFSNKANDQKIRLEEVVSEKERLLQRKQISIQNLSEEITKANEIISKLQGELAVVNSKMKVRTTIALEQEKVVEMNKVKISELETILSEKEVTISNLRDTEGDLRKTVEELKKLLEEREKAIKDNERIIEWLNHRATEAEANAWNANMSLHGSTPHAKEDIDPSSIRTDMPSFINGTKTPVAEVTEKLGGASLAERVLSSRQARVRSKANVINETVHSGPKFQSSTGNSKPRVNSVKATPTSASSKTVKPAKPIGFKRVSLVNEVTTIPSSYFSK